MATFIKVNLLIISIILFEFAWLYAAKAEETIDYECPSVAGAALEAGYSLRAFDNDLWELSKSENSVFYILENPEVCSYKIFANILSDDDLYLSVFINKWHKEKLIGRIYKEDNGYVFQNSILLPHASEELLEININVFDITASVLLDEIDEHLTNISLPEKEDTPQHKNDWFKATVMACPDDTDSCILLEDSHGPFPTHAECYERSLKIVDDTHGILGDGDYSYKCEQSI